MAAAKKEIILGVSGSIAAYKSCDIVRRFKEQDFSVTAVLTREAQAFITALTLQTLSGNKVYSEMFEVPDKWEIGHISLARRASLVLIAPATANIISKLAVGICDDLLTTTVLATTAPILIAPAMDENMYKHKITQDNIAKLKKYGYRFIGPVRGKLASGETGLGHLAKVEDIVGEAKRILR